MVDSCGKCNLTTDGREEKCEVGPARMDAGEETEPHKSQTVRRSVSAGGFLAVFVSNGCLPLAV